jgi:hypothetical protein
VLGSSDKKEFSEGRRGDAGQYLARYGPARRRNEHGDHHSVDQSEERNAKWRIALGVKL